MYQPTLWRRRAGLVKPSGIPRIDWSHPLAKGLVFYGFDTGQGRIIDLVAGRPATFIGTPPTLAPIPGGYGYGLSWGGAGSAYFPQDTAVQVTGDLSFACAYLQTGAVGSYATVFCRTAFDNGQQPYVNWGYELNAGAAGQNIGNVLGNAADVLVTSPNWTGNASDVFTVVDGVIDQGFLYFHAQGRDIGSIACAQTSENTNADVFFSGTNTASAQNEFVGFILFGAMWRRALSQSEAQLLAAAPWDFLRFPADFSRGRARRFALPPSGMVIIADSLVGLAFAAAMRGDRWSANTNSAGQARDAAAIPLAASVTQRLDATLQGDAVADVWRDVSPSAGSASHLAVDVVLWGESGTGQRREPPAAAESVTTERRAVMAPAENTGALGVFSDRLVPAENIVGMRADAMPAAEDLDIVRGDFVAAGESLSARSRGTITIDELSAAMRAEPSAAVEWQGAMALVAGARAAIEIMVGMRRDAAAPNAALAMSGQDVMGGFAALASVGRDPRAPLEALSTGATPVAGDSAGAIEWIARTAGDTLAPGEFLGQALTIIGAPVPVEWQAIMAELLIDVGIWIEAQQLSTIPLLSVGRLLASPGKRRLL